MGLQYRCHNCTNYQRAEDKQRARGYLPLSRYLNLFLELHMRLGVSEASRRLGLSRAGFHKIIYRQNRRVCAETVRRALELRRELRAAGAGEAVCEYCGGSVVPSRLGRLKRFCSHSCASYALYA